MSADTARVPDALAGALNALADATGRRPQPERRGSVPAAPVTVSAATGGRLRLLVPAGPIGGENPNLCAGRT